MHNSMSRKRACRVFVALSLLAFALMLPVLCVAQERGIQDVVDGTWLKKNDLAEIGQYYALIIGIDDYQNNNVWHDLRCAANDARQVARLLQKDYAFGEVVLLLNKQATRKRILQELWNLRKKVTPRDSVLIYYSGHGRLEGGLGYWVPSDGGRDDADYISHADVRGKLRTDWLKARHVLIVSDSCFAAALFRGGDKVPEVTPPYIHEALRTPSRQCLTSGGLTPVPDGAAGNNSVFSRYFLDALKKPARDVFVPSDFYARLRANVNINAPRIRGKYQNPQLGILEQAGHEVGGEFVFIRRKGAAPPRPETPKAEKEDISEAQRKLRRLQAIQLMDTEFKAARLYDESARYSPKQKLANWKAFGAKFARQDFYDKGAYVAARIAQWRNYKPPARTSSDRTLTLDLGGGVTMKLVLIPAGEFMMGSSLSADDVHRRWPGGKKEWYEDEHPQHRVRITKPFYMGVREVTLAEFRRFVNASGHTTDAEAGGGAYGWTGKKWEKRKGVNWRNPGFAQDDSHPVACVSWNDATAFCDWLSRQTGRKVRLPTEAEWEYACRAGTRARYWWGDSETEAGKFANVADLTAKKKWTNWIVFDTDDGHAVTAPVASYRPNAFGLYDMIGNVWEWCADWYDEDYYSNSPTDDPTGPAAGKYRVWRGGSWNNNPDCVRSANRGGNYPAYGGNFGGLRVVVSSQ